MLVDSHCHLHMLDLTLFENDLAAVIEQAREQDVGYLLNVCTQLSDVQQILAIAAEFDNVGASVGIHPNESLDSNDTFETLYRLAKEPACIAIGETGLDYYRTEEIALRPKQQQRFIEHIQISNELNKPLIIHSRAAADDTLAIMKNQQAQRGVMHCFCETWPVAEQALACGFYISLSGIVTFKNAKALQEVAQRVPIERLLIETDCPYLAPVPHRGQSNQPAYVRYTAEKIAELRGLSYEEVAKHTTNNFFELFQLAKRPLWKQ